MGKPKTVEEKRCGKCKKPLPIESFSFKNKKDGIRHAWCRECFNITTRQHYRNNKQRYIQLTKVRNARVRSENRHKLLDYLRNHPCVDCGKPDLIFLQFDHVRGKKKGTVPKMVADGFSWKVVVAEIRKCQIRCVECHILKTAREQRHWMLEFI